MKYNLKYLSSFAVLPALPAFTSNTTCNTSAFSLFSTNIFCVPHVFYVNSIDMDVDIYTYFSDSTHSQRLKMFNYVEAVFMPSAEFV